MTFLSHYELKTMMYFGLSFAALQSLTQILWVNGWLQNIGITDYVYLISDKFIWVTLITSFLLVPY